MSDLISRQVAIDTLEREQSLVERSITETRWFDLGLRKAQEVLNGLPSAQPKIKCIAKVTLTDDQVKEAFEKAKGAILTVEPVNHWIPCSERLPEEDKDVLISYRYKEGEGDTSHVEIDITSYGTVCFGGRQIHALKEWRQPFDYFHANYEVVAWMPLPKPYRGNRLLLEGKAKGDREWHDERMNRL